jgi:hypothetical protein
MKRDGERERVCVCVGVWRRLGATYGDIKLLVLIAQHGVPGNQRLSVARARRRLLQHTSAYVSIRQHTPAYVSIRQHTSAYVSIRKLLALAGGCCSSSSSDVSICAFVLVKQVN